MENCPEPHWKHFDYLGGNGIRCVHCSRIFDVSNSTTENPMARHLEASHRVMYPKYKAAMRRFLVQQLGSLPVSSRMGLDLIRIEVQLPSMQDVCTQWPDLVKYFEKYYQAVGRWEDVPDHPKAFNKAHAHAAAYGSAYSETEWNSSVGGNRYSKMLEEAIRQHEEGQECVVGVEEYSRIKELFRLPDKEKTARSRYRNNAAYYCYVIIDSTKIHIEGYKLFWDGTFEEFIDAIFYIGKGVGGRSVYHCEDAAMHNIGDDREKLKRILPNGIKCDEVALLKTALTGRKNPNMLERILDLWERNLPAIVFDSFLRNVSEKAAFGFETALLAARGPNGMANVNFGVPMGPIEGWPIDDVARLGTRLLFNAYHCFKSSMLRVFYERDFDVHMKSFIFQNLARRRKLDKMVEKRRPGDLKEKKRRAEEQAKANAAEGNSEKSSDEDGET